VTATETVSTTPTAAAPGRAGGLAIGLLSAAAFALSGSFGHALLEDGWSPAALVAARVGGAFLVLLLPCVLVLRRTGLPSLRQSGQLGAQLFYFSALQYLSVGVALLLEYLAPVVLIGWRWVHGDRPTPAIGIGAGLALVGLALVLDVRHGLTVSAIGLAYGLGAMLCLAGYFVLAEPRPGGQTVPPLLLTTAGTGVGALVLLGVGATGLLPLAASTGPTTLAGASVPWWAPLSMLILVSAVLAYLTGVVAVRRLGSAIASFVALTEVLFAVVFAAVLLGQVPSSGQVLGGLLVLAGIVVVQGGSATAPPWAAGRVLFRRLRSTMRR
jgi:drug/metabolite transporter (DMT)-like permease